jgi:PPOX class probable F420-dependent enzyme
MARMDDEEVAAFLGELPARTGKLATVRADGRPHVAPVGDLVLTTVADSVKGRNIRRDPRVALCVDDDRPPFSFVTVEGVASVGEDRGELLHWATVIGGRYMGDDRAEAYGARNGVAGELLVRIRPTHIVAVTAVSD